MNTETLFQASLNKDEEIKMESYNLSYLLYVAFFGGLVPLMALGTKNAKRLGIDKKIINILIAVGSLMLLSKVIVSGMVVSKVLVINSRTIRWFYRIASVLLYIVYNRVMSKRYNIFLVYGGQPTPILKDTIKWLIISTLLEGTLITLFGFITKLIF